MLCCVVMCRVASKCCQSMLKKLIDRTLYPLLTRNTNTNTNMMVNQICFFFFYSFNLISHLYLNVVFKVNLQKGYFFLVHSSRYHEEGSRSCTFLFHSSHCNDYPVMLFEEKATKNINTCKRSMKSKSISTLASRNRQSWDSQIRLSIKIRLFFPARGRMSSSLSTSTDTLFPKKVFYSLYFSLCNIPPCSFSFNIWKFER